MSSDDVVITVRVPGRARPSPRPRPLFRLGLPREAPGTVTPTPQYRAPSWCRGETIVATEITSSQQVPVSVTFTDKKGNPAPVDGVPEWMTDAPAVLALQPAADGLSCVVSAVGPIGVGTVTLRADADLGAGVEEVIGTLEVDVIAGRASVVVLTPGTPTEQP